MDVVLDGHGVYSLLGPVGLRFTEDIKRSEFLEARRISNAVDLLRSLWLSTGPGACGKHMPSCELPSVEALVVAQNSLRLVK